ncbi:bifunctional DNA-formamidopyrimidine glycosylase/DNA-(apurinic or apyrimidinic site) lyase [Candidatus Chlorohelix sp.]|uniref:bifunctional DNA-formamidopyrimidine glycosylase/DNA-(apurinic or apyrimidinic site) lyase n=1 Tax=Candidatus Chlorohelix sp. TaxID=3139201 RepID=UPI00303BDA46
MPELPEVETTVRDLQRVLPGKIIRGVTFADWERMVQTHPVAELSQLIAGEKIIEVSRRAKYVLVALTNSKHLVFHRKMTGNLFYRASNDPTDRYTRFIIAFEDSTELRFADLRKFGRIYLFTSDEELSQYLAHLGPEPLTDSFTEELFESLLVKRKGMLKPLLLNQSVLVGLGNIYVNEALWVSRLHPQRRAESLTAEDRQRLYHAIREVLAKAVENRGTTLSDYLDGEGQRGRNQDLLFVHAREGEACPNCEQPISYIFVGQRGTYLCLNCQPTPTGVVMQLPNKQRPHRNTHPTP